VDVGYREARAAIERALALDQDLGAAHASLGEIQMLHDWDWTGAAASYQRALMLEPGDAGVLRAAGSLARYLGRLDDALARYQRSIEIDALNSNGYKNLGIILYYAGRYDDARAALGKALDLTPEIGFAHGLIGQVYLAQSRPEASLAEAEKERHPAYRLCGLAMAYHALGRKKESDANLAELIAHLQGDAPYQIAEVYAFRGEANLAFHWLDRAYTDRDGGLTEMKVDPLLNKLRRDARFTALLKKMRLPL
jgi:tetratricopeptide (TPR) repeat protein